MGRPLWRAVLLLGCGAAVCRGQQDQCSDWGLNFLIILLPMLIIALLAFAFAVYRALHFRNLFRKMHEANQIYLFEQKTAAANVQKKGQGADAIALDLNKAHIKELQDDNARLARELNQTREDLVAATSQLRAAQEQLMRQRAAEHVVERPVGVTRVVEVPVDRIVEVTVPHVVEVPRVVERTVEVQRLVVDQSAQRQLHAAHEDIEALKRELHAARSSSTRPRTSAAEEPMMDDMPNPYAAYDTTPLMLSRSPYDSPGFPGSSPGALPLSAAFPSVRPPNRCS